MTTQAKSAQAIKAMIDDVKKNQGRFYQSVQHTLKCIAHHAHKHGDWTLVNDLLKSFESGSRKQGVVNWAHKFMGLQWDAKTQKFVAWSGKDYIADNIEEGKKTMWNTCASEEHVVKPYDINKELTKVINAFNRHKEQMKNLSDEDKAKFNLDVKNEIVKNMLVMLDFDVILKEDAA